MVLTTIFAIRHGFRAQFHRNPQTGEIKLLIPSPTSLATDPELTSYGVKQSEELALIADSLDPKVSRIYTSPSYRCVQTITPLAGRMPHVPIIVDQGLGDWFGKALVEYPPPPDLQTLRRFFPKLTEQSSYAIPRYGEGLEEVHDRVAYVLARIIADADVACTLDRPEAIIISTHAAVLITMGRALTGRVPEDRTEKDFDTYTCSVSTYKRKQQFSNQDLKVWKLADPVPKFAWRGNGVGGGWNCTVNAGVQHLTNGGERNWHFSGDEGFVDAMRTDDERSLDNDLESDRKGDKYSRL